MKIILFFIIFAASFQPCLFPQEEFAVYSDNELAIHIKEVLLKNYDKKPCSSAEERIMLLIAKKSYIRMLSIWIENLNDINRAEFEYDPLIYRTIKTIEKNSTMQNAARFRILLRELSLLSLKNFEMYLDSVNKSGRKSDINEITCAYIDECLCTEYFYEKQCLLYKTEGGIRKELGMILSSPDVKDRFYFEIFLFKTIDRIRQITIDRHLAGIYRKMNVIAGAKP